MILKRGDKVMITKGQYKGAKGRVSSLTYQFGQCYVTVQPDVNADDRVFKIEEVKKHDWK